MSPDDGTDRRCAETVGYASLCRQPPSPRAQAHGGYVATTVPLTLTTVLPSGWGVTFAPLGTS